MNASEVIEITPGANAQPIHRDQELYPAALGTHLNNSASEHLLSADASARAAGLRTMLAVMDPGDCIFFSGKILHGSGANGTARRSYHGPRDAAEGRVRVTKV
ncbi:hypothetical protein JI435_447710 [Parastagonospora nodorum SN15]|uniref:Phytanoyl-CoA dioxygenase family protein n=1 Tax=Phaeosphaeria nodorum (strain SN15 / ATCC MYA-4574 / FGSC 10173) TaxID=321614 RepID=A0A7U2NRC1_PHANO|nr:hypothetical protein HBI10_191510 [Parastagonospora nodorum]QRD07592.1 hypothetical protein JI435_447710 [Parastagonospora nodorum SN15]KAH4013346.1 hypothetical protein HBI09_216410 [Parastagonospora nodorum]KAH4151589.1 hypothetical protein HBH43_238600 [Parastagonospora nodorum]KAH4215721.1 hypothetical protein HBI06_242870 [Parastagonospora nodorum]